MVLNKSNLFDPVLVTDLINKVKGESALAQLSQQQPVPFNGQKEFIFTMENEIDVVAESGKKSHGGVSLEPIIITPIKVEYGARVSNEFMIASEEEQINILKAFNDGFARKVARGLDLMAFHGVNPRTGQPTDVIGNNCFDATVTQKVLADTASDPNGAVESAIALVHGSDEDVTGMAISQTFRSALAKQKDAQGLPMFPELAWGNAPSEINGLPVVVNRTVSDMSGDETVHAYVGDFQNAFKWGYSKQIPLRVIEYGDPDNSGNDLQGYNQVYIRAELYLGWGILEPNAFAIIVE